MAKQNHLLMVILSVTPAEHLIKLAKRSEHSEIRCRSANLSIFAGKNHGKNDSVSPKTKTPHNREAFVLTGGR